LPLSETVNEMSSRHSSPQFKMKTGREKQQPCPLRKLNLKSVEQSPVHKLSSA